MESMNETLKYIAIAFGAFFVLRFVIKKGFKSELKYGVSIDEDPPSLYASQMEQKQASTKILPLEQQKHRVFEMQKALLRDDFGLMKADDIKPLVESFHSLRDYACFNRHFYNSGFGEFNQALKEKMLPEEFERINYYMNECLDIDL